MSFFRKKEQQKPLLLLGSPKVRPTLDDALNAIGIKPVDGTHGKNIQFTSPSRSLITVENIGDYVATTSQEFEGERPLVAFPIREAKLGDRFSIAETVGEFTVHLVSNNRRIVRGRIKEVEQESIEFQKSGIPQTQLEKAAQIALTIRQKVEDSKTVGGTVDMTGALKTMCATEGVPIHYAQFMVDELVKKWPQDKARKQHYRTKHEDLKKQAGEVIAKFVELAASVPPQLRPGVIQVEKKDEAIVGGLTQDGKTVSRTMNGDILKRLPTKN